MLADSIVIGKVEGDTPTVSAEEDGKPHASNVSTKPQGERSNRQTM